MSKRTNLNALLFMLVFLLAMVGTAFAEPLLFPIQVGVRCEYNRSDGTGNEWTVLFEIDHQKTINSSIYFHLQRRNYHNDGARKELGYVRLTEEAMYGYNPNGSGPEDDYLTWQEADVGTKWSYYQDDPSSDLDYVVREIIAIESVTVPYPGPDGTFTAYVHRKYWCVNPDNLLLGKSTDWDDCVVTGVGWVKEVVYPENPGDPKMTMELVRVISAAEAGLDIEGIYMASCKDYLDGTAISNPWFFMALIDFVDTGSLASIDMTLPDGFTTYPLDNENSSWGYESRPTVYPTLAGLRTVYPEGTYTFDFRDSSGSLIKSVQLDYSGIGEPGSPVDFTYPSYNGQMGISTNPTFTWTIDSGAGDALGIWFDDYYEFLVPMDILSWQPGPLNPEQNYWLYVDIFRAKDWAGGPGLPTKTVGGDEFEYGLLMVYHNDIEFTTGPTVEDALDIEGISMCSQKDHLDGTAVSSNPWRFEVDIRLVDTGSLANIDMTLPGGSTTYPLDNENGSWRYESSPTLYPTLTALRAIYPTGLYTFDFRDSSGSLIKSVQLDYSGIDEPGSPVDFTYPSDDGQTGISTNPIFTWNVNSEAGDGLGMALKDDYEKIYWDGSFTMETLSWQPGPLDPEQNYWLYVTVVRVKDWAGGPGLPTKTVGGDEFEYVLHIGNCNKIGFTTNPTATPHPADKDNDYVIDDFELLDYIDLWAQGQVDDFDLLDTIDLWAAGHY